MRGPAARAAPIALTVFVLVYAGYHRPAPRAATYAGGSGTAQVQILAINDLHGGIEPRLVGGRPAGGVATLAAYLQARRTDQASTITVHAGDLFGGSPPISALLGDEPAIIAADLMGVEIGAAGNHEFDRGLPALQRLVLGGCDANDHCFAGSRMQYLAANVLDEATSQPVFPPFTVRVLDGVPVGFIGVTLHDTGSIVRQQAVAGLRFLDEVEVINQGVAELQAMGVHAIVALVHQGGEGSPGGGSVRGTEITRIAEGIDPDVDVIVSGHSHRGYQGFIAGKLVTQAYAYGTAIADIRLTIDRGSGDVTDKSAAIVTTYADRLPPDPYVQAWVDAWRALVQPLVDRVVGVAAERIVRNETPGEESAIGNLVSDAFRAATGAQIACLNAGGDRADIPAGPVTWSRLFEVQPFGNELVTLLLTGAQIERVLNEQWANQPNPFVMKCSGMVYTWDAAEPDGARVTLAEVALADGTPLQADGVYTFTVNDFLADGAQNFTVFLESPLRLPGPVDVDALVEYVERLPQPFTMRVEGRINRRN